MSELTTGLWETVPKLAVELVIVGAFLCFLYYSQTQFMMRLEQQEASSVERGKEGHTALGTLVDKWQARWDKQDEQFDEMILQLDQVGDEVREQNRYLLRNKENTVIPE